MFSASGFLSQRELNNNEMYLYQGARGGKRALGCYKSLCWRTSLILHFSYHVLQKNQKGAVSEKCKKGTGSPILWQVSETTGTTTETIPSRRGVQRSHQADPYIGIGIMHLGVAGFQLSELIPRLKFRPCWLKSSLSLHCDPRAQRWLWSGSGGRRWTHCPGLRALRCLLHSGDRWCEQSQSCVHPPQGY